MGDSTISENNKTTTKQKKPHPPHLRPHPPVLLWQLDVRKAAEAPRECNCEIVAGVAQCTLENTQFALELQNYAVEPGGRKGGAGVVECHLLGRPRM